MEFDVLHKAKNSSLFLQPSSEQPNFPNLSEAKISTPAK
jgi:hypothetical protein